MGPDATGDATIPEFESWILGKTYDDLLVWLDNHRNAIAKTCEDALIRGRPASTRQTEILCIELEWIETPPVVDQPRFKVIDVVLRDLAGVAKRYHTTPHRQPGSVRSLQQWLDRPLDRGNEGTVIVNCSCVSQLSRRRRRSACAAGPRPCS